MMKCTNTSKSEVWESNHNSGDSRGSNPPLSPQYKK